MRRSLSRAGLAALVAAGTLATGLSPAHAAARSTFNEGTVSGDQSSTCGLTWTAISFHDNDLVADASSSSSGPADPADTGIPASPPGLTKLPGGQAIAPEDADEAGFHTVVHPDVSPQSGTTSDGSFYIDHVGIASGGSSSGPLRGTVTFTYVIQKDAAIKDADLSVSLPPLDTSATTLGWDYQNMTVAPLSADYPNAASITTGPTVAGETINFTADFPQDSYLVLRFEATFNNVDNIGGQPDHISDTFTASGNLTATTCGTVRGVAWMDDDADNVRDAGEAPKPGVRVDLLRDGTIIETATTDSDGAYSFTKVPNGPYEVSFKDGQRSAITVENNEVVVDQPYRDAATGTIIGVTWVDMDRDGQREAGEPPQPAIRVELRDSVTGAVIATQISDDDGAYAFDNVPAGTYDVWFQEGDQHRVEVRDDTVQVDQPYLPAEEPAPSPTGTSLPSPSPEPTQPEPEPTVMTPSESPAPTITETTVVENIRDKTLAYTGGPVPLLVALAAILGGLGMAMTGGAHRGRRGLHE